MAAEKGQPLQAWKVGCIGRHHRHLLDYVQISPKGAADIAEEKGPVPAG